MEWAFGVVSLIIALTDVLFVYINYRNDQKGVSETLAFEGRQHEAAFNLVLHNEGLHMQQLAAYVASLPEVRDTFLEGSRAVMAEGGGPGGPRAAEARARLFDLVAPAWETVTRDYKTRQLHFHIAPGNTSFLRVHQPGRFGDDLTELRHIITYATERRLPVHGFESGRVHSGIRGAVPILGADPATDNARVVGVLEAGSSFTPLLRSLERDTDTTYTVLVNRAHVEDAYWPELVEQLAEERAFFEDWFIEATSDPVDTRHLLGEPRVQAALAQRVPVLVRLGTSSQAVYSFPLRDFLGTIDPRRPPIGAVVTWHDATAVVAAAEAALADNVKLGIAGFVLVEVLLFLAWTFARRRLQSVIDGQVAELSETNRRLEQAILHRDDTERKLKAYQNRLEALVDQRTRSLSATVEALRREVAQRTTVEQQLQRERDLAQTTLHSIGDGVITTDGDGNVQYLNPAAETLTGWDNATAIGMHLRDVFQARDMDRDGTPLEYGTCLAGQSCERQHGENTQLTRRDGVVITVEHSVSPILGDRGEHVGLVLVFHDDTEARQLAVQLSYQATHDALTGLVNRHAIEAELADTLHGCRTDGSGHAFLYIDLDQFKVVNDTCGHVAGDELLRHVSRLFQQRTRQADCLARLGGDEFGLLLRGCGPDKAKGIAEGLLASLSGFRFVWIDRVFAVGASIGVVGIDAHAESVEAILSAADTACYLAKEKGRNRVHLSLPDDDELARRRGEMQWVSRIQEALAQDRFELHWQPIVPVGSSAAGPAYCEVLVRMLDERGRMVSPAAFIPAAERYGLMGAVDRWVIDRALRIVPTARPDWSEQGIGWFSINLSGDTMADPGILQFIRERFALYEVDPNRVCFEVTETAAIANLASAIELVTELKKDGCHFALDDFGSGLSSFGYLKELPVDHLKIDGNFVKHLDSDPVDRVMVQAINDVGHAMQLKTIAEFVESDATMELLRQIGVDFAQGYAIGKPMAVPLPKASGVDGMPRERTALVAT